MHVHNTAKAAPRRKKGLRRVLWSILSLVLFLLFTGVLVFFLVPYTASQPWFREIIESYASKNLKRRVSIASMAFGWEKGLQMESVRVMDDPLFSRAPMGSIGALEFTVDFSDLFKTRRLVCGVTLDAPALFIVKEKDGRTNIQRLLADLAAPGKPDAPAPGGNDRALALPVADFQGTCRIRGMQIRYEDRIQNQTVRLHDGSLDIKIPSLFKAPLLVNASAQVHTRNRPLPPVSAFLTIEDLFDDSRTLQLQRARLEADVSAPGIQVHLNGDLSQKKASAGCRVNLEILLPVLRSFLPEMPIPLKDAGRCDVTATVTRIDDTTAAFDAGIRLDGLHIQGPSFSTEKADPEPITLAFHQNGSIHFPRKILLIESGALTLNSSRIHWQGEIAESRMRLSAGPLILDLPELLAAAGSFLPEPFPLTIPASSGSEIKIEKMDISGDPVQGRIAVEIANLTGSLNRFGLFLIPDAPVAQGEQLKFLLPQAQCDLVAFAPAKIFARGAATVAKLRLHGKNEITVDSLALSEFQLTAAGIESEQTAPFGFILPFVLSAALEADGIQAMDLAPAEFKLSGLEIKGDLGTDTFATAAVDDMHLYIPGFNRRDPAVGRVNGDVFIKIRVPHLRIKSLNPLQGDVKGFTGRLLVDKGIEAVLKADALDLGRQGFTADASVTADLEQTRRILPDLLPDMPRFSGNALVQCRLSGRLPESALSPASIRTSFFDPESSFIDSATLSLDLSRIAGSWPFSSKEALIVESITTQKPLSYRFDGKTRSGTLSGEIQVKAIPPFALPVQDSAGPPSSVAFHLAVTGEHDRLTAASFSTTLNIQPLGASGEASFSVEGIDAAFKSSPSWDPMTWLQHITGIARITGTLPENSKIVPAPETTLQGGVKIGAEFETAPEKGMRIRMSADTKDLDIEKTGTFSIQNLETALIFEKQYRVSRQDLRGKEKTDHLSETVIRDRVKGQRGASEPDTLAHRDARLQARLDPTPSLVFGPAHVSLSPHVLPIRHGAVTLSFVEGLPRLPYLEIHFLGGALLGTAGVFRKNDRLTLEAQLVFSDIDLKQILGGHETALKEEDAAIGGQLEIDFPLVLSMPRLLESLRLSLQFNHIGSRAFGRMLYLLDPYESNETIVSQRRLLRSGVPRWIDIHVQNGILSLDGEVVIKGIPIQIPHLERLNLAAISGLKAYEGYLTALGDLNRVLDLTSDPELFLERMKP